MKTNALLSCMCAGVFLAGAPGAQGAGSSSSFSSSSSSSDKYAISVGVRRHVDHTIFTTLPFEEGDMSYDIALESHNDSAGWQLVFAYTPDVSGEGLVNQTTQKVDRVMTPQLNLLLKDGIWRGGVGILASYLRTDTESDWTDLYYQFTLGISLPISSFDIDISAFYTFEKWDLLEEFEFDDIELGARLRYTFQ
jgi:hypothetical protein